MDTTPAHASDLPVEYQRVVARLERGGMTVEVSTSTGIGGTLAHVFATDPDVYGERLTFGVSLAGAGRRRPRYLGGRIWYGGTTGERKLATKRALHAYALERGCRA